jgi:transposase
VQIVIALVVTPEGLPLAYEVLPGNTADKTTLRPFLEHIERQYGKARRVAPPAAPGTAPRSAPSQGP